MRATFQRTHRSSNRARVALGLVDPWNAPTYDASSRRASPGMAVWANA